MRQKESICHIKTIAHSLELVSWLPNFLDGLFVFLSDTHVEVRTATLTVLGDFLREIIQVVGRIMID